MSYKKSLLAEYPLSLWSHPKLMMVFVVRRPFHEKVSPLQRIPLIMISCGDDGWWRMDEENRAGVKPVSVGPVVFVNLEDNDAGVKAV